ncbi:MAG: PIN domain-containing protein [Burkholderiales bacterium]
MRTSSQDASRLRGPSWSYFACDIVLAESAWALRSVYRSTTEEIAYAIEATLAQPAYVFENRDAVASALIEFRAGSADFADCLIAAKCKAVGAEFTATFDRKMKSLPGVKVIGSQ